MASVKLHSYYAVGATCGEIAAWETHSSNRALRINAGFGHTYVHAHHLKGKRPITSEEAGLLIQKSTSRTDLMREGHRHYVEHVGSVAVVRPLWPLVGLSLHGLMADYPSPCGDSFLCLVCLRTVSAERLAAHSSDGPCVGEFMSWVSANSYINVPFLEEAI
jgi:hypothetical protein